jgi:hypothetical protein
MNEKYGDSKKRKEERRACWCVYMNDGCGAEHT